MPRFYECVRRLQTDIITQMNTCTLRVSSCHCFLSVNALQCTVHCKPLPSRNVNQVLGGACTKIYCPTSEFYCNSFCVVEIISFYRRSSCLISGWMKFTRNCEKACNNIVKVFSWAKVLARLIAVACNHKIHSI